MAPEDPWDWNVDQVVQYLCFSHDSWAGEIRGQYEFPSVSGLETQLREQGIRGWILLTAVDHDLLKSEFGINSIAQRAAIIFAIKTLREQSPKYNLKAGLAAPSAPPPEPADSTSQRSRPASPSRSPVALKRSREDTPVSASSRKHTPKRRRLDVSTQLTTLPLADATKSNSADASTSNNRNIAIESPCTKLSIDDIFFSDYDGSELIPAASDDFDDNKPPDYSLSFSRNKQASRQSTVANRFVNKALKSFFLRNERQEHFNGDEKITVVFPYNHSRHVRSDRLRGRFIFTSGPDRVTCRPSIPICDEWTYLEKWNQHSKIVSLDELSELGSVVDQTDGSASEDDSIIVEDAPADERLTAEAVSYIIDVALKRYVDTWKANKMPKLIEKEETRLVRMSLRAPDRERIVAQLQKEISHYDSLLQRHRSEIVSQVWSGVEEVDRICAVFEQTAYNKEECVWRLSVVNKSGRNSLTREPARKVKYRKKQTAKPVSKVDDMADFIVDDDDLEPVSLITIPRRKTVSPRSPVPIPKVELDDKLTILLDDNVSTACPSPTKGQQVTNPSLVKPRLPSPPLVTDQAPSHPEWPSFIGPNIEVIDLYSNSEDDEPSPQQAKVAAKAKIECKDIWIDKEFWESLEKSRNAIRLLTAVVTNLLDAAQLSHLNHLLSRKTDLWWNMKATMSWLARGAKYDRPSKAVFTLGSQLFLVFINCSLDAFRKPPRELDVMARQALMGPLKTPPPKEGEEFYQTLRNAVTAREDALKAMGVEPADLDCVEDGDSDMPQTAGRKALQTNQVAKKAREGALLRQAEQLNREETLKQVPVEHNGERSIVINILKKDNEPAICLHPAIANKVQEHQIDGIRFMWREVIVAARETGDPQGCLLAHTMGLGKTMQTISFLVTVTEAARSRDVTVRDQLPKLLKHCQILISCPSGLVDNWMAELERWVPRPLEASVGKIRSITSEMPKSTRLYTLNMWSKQGGILVIGFSLLVLMADPGRTADYPGAREKLLHGPRIVVADEAHNLKNPDSKLAAVARSFKTGARIALTGSPLANNLREYFSLVDWISPGYLGPATEFAARFQRPIEEGLYAESLPFQRRMALKWLAVLKKEIEPKVNRADITVLKGKLPPKVEFILTVSLTDLQKECYSLYVDHIREGRNGNDDITNSSLWSFTSALMMLCNHPRVFYNNLFDNPKHKAAATPKDAQEDDNEDAESETVPLWSIQLKERFAAIFQDVPNLQSETLSARTAIFLKIVRLTMAVGEQLLAFTHSLGMLRYLEDMMKSLNVPYVRLDGSTRHSVRNERMKAFNEGKAGVFLISSRAGGYGFNLPGASRVVIFDSGFNPVHEEQAVARAYRIGQKRQVFVYRFVTGGTFQEQLNNQSVFKTQLALRVNDAKNIKSLAMKPGDYIYHPREISGEDLTKYKGKDVGVLDKIIAENEGRMIHRISTMETLQAKADDDLTPEELREVEQIRTIGKMLKPRAGPDGTSKSHARKAGVVFTGAPAPSAGWGKPAHWARTANSYGSAENVHGGPTHFSALRGGAPVSQPNEHVPVVFTQPGYAVPVHHYPSELPSRSYGFPPPAAPVSLPQETYPGAPTAFSATSASTPGLNAVPASPLLDSTSAQSAHSSSQGQTIGLQPPQLHLPTTPHDLTPGGPHSSGPEPASSSCRILSPLAGPNSSECSTLSSAKTPAAGAPTPKAQTEPSALPSPLPGGAPSAISFPHSDHPALGADLLRPDSLGTSGASCPMSISSSSTTSSSRSDSSYSPFTNDHGNTAPTSIASGPPSSSRENPSNGPRQGQSQTESHGSAPPVANATNQVKLPEVETGSATVAASAPLESVPTEEIPAPTASSSADPPQTTPTSAFLLSSILKYAPDPHRNAAPAQDSPNSGTGPSSSNENRNNVSHPEPRPPEPDPSLSQYGHDSLPARPPISFAMKPKTGRGTHDGTDHSAHPTTHPLLSGHSARDSYHHSRPQSPPRTDEWNLGRGAGYHHPLGASYNSPSHSNANGDQRQPEGPLPQMPSARRWNVLDNRIRQQPQPQQPPNGSHHHHHSIQSAGSYRYQNSDRELGHASTIHPGGQSPASSGVSSSGNGPEWGRGGADGSAYEGPPRRPSIQGPNSGRGGHHDSSSHVHASALRLGSSGRSLSSRAIPSAPSSRPLPALATSTSATTTRASTPIPAAVPPPTIIAKPPPLRPLSPKSIAPTQLREETETLKQPEWLRQQIIKSRVPAGSAAFSAGVVVGNENDTGTGFDSASGKGDKGAHQSSNPNFVPLGRRHRNLF